jgi:hypothetical protein
MTSRTPTGCSCHHLQGPYDFIYEIFRNTHQERPDHQLLGQDISQAILYCFHKWKYSFIANNNKKMPWFSHTHTHTHTQQHTVIKSHCDTWVIQSSTMRHSQKGEASQMSIGDAGWTDAVNHTKEHLLALKRKEMQTPATMWWSQEVTALSERTNTVWFHLGDFLVTGKFRYRKEMASSRGRGEGMESWCFTATVSALQDGDTLETGGGACPAMGLLLTLLHCTLAVKRVLLWYGYLSVIVFN